MDENTSSSEPSLLWVNHASFVFRYDGVNLMTDPWLFGSAFNNGWDLLSETQFAMHEFHDITHLWFSHEHPDHFSPPVLQKIPEEARAKITVLFQETKDKKVLKYCRKMGFQVQELQDKALHKLTDKVSVKCGKVPFFDSWLLIETDKGKILNANDCVVDGEGVAHEIAETTGTVDVLLTQFSYANWVGNPEEVEERQAAAKEKLDRVLIQVEAFQPKQTIPFASFVFFSHEENHYLNDEINTIRDAETFIREKTKSEPIVLYPGEQWIIGTSHGNETSLTKYDRDYDLSERPLHQAISTELSEVQSASANFIKRMRERNSGLLIKAMKAPPLRYFQPFQIYLTDLSQLVRFDMKHGLQVMDGSAEDADVELASESLAYIFKFDWGYDTLVVNGRFRASPEGHKRMLKNFFLGPLNNTGRYLKLSTFLDPSFIKRAIAKLRSLK